MKHKLIITCQLTLSLILILHCESSIGKALTPEDVKGLLPPTPQDKNETIAQIVQDPVVQDAVHHAASNNSLNGLVVKKNVYIMPATNPKMVLSKREHLLVVPTENLEDVRKNITETKRSESSTIENESYFKEDGNEYSSERNESGVDEMEEDPLSEKRKSETEYLKDAVSEGSAIPEDSSLKKVAVPIVAVIDPSKNEKGKVNSPIVAILPNQVNNEALNGQVQFLKDNSEKIQKKAQDFVDRTTMAADYRRFSASSEIPVLSSTVGQIVSTSLLSEEEIPKLVTEEVYLTPMMVPRLEMIPASFEGNQADYLHDTGDMEVAEDIIFRPLFRYRQESQQRSKYYDDSNRRRGYDYANYYPRRAYFYRPRYDEY